MVANPAPFSSDSFGNDFYRQHTLEELAAQQGTAPVDFEQLMAESSFWPEGEKMEDFLSFLDELRGRQHHSG